MQKVKEVAEISKEIIQKLDEAIVQTINVRILYEKYKSLLDEVKSIHEKNMFRYGAKFINGFLTSKVRLKMSNSKVVLGKILAS